MNNKIKFLIKIIFFVIAIIISYFFINNNLETFKKIFNIKFYHLIIISTITFIELVISGFLFRTLLEFFNIKLKFKEWFGLTVINRYSDYLLTKSGTIIRSFYLKKIYNFTYKNFIFIFLLVSLIQIICISTLSEISLLFNYYKINIFNGYLFIFLLIISIISIIILSFLTKILIFLSKKYKSGQQLMKTWLIIKKEKKKFIKPIFLIFTLILLSSFKIFFIYSITFESILFSSAIIIASMGMLSFFISITPAGIGIREALMSYAAQLSGENLAEAAAVASLGRAITMFWVFLLGFLFSIWYSKEMAKNKKTSQKIS